MKSDSNGKNNKKKYFKQTRDLIKIAKNEGWTQKEIADKCRVQQSIVSAWEKGAKKGTEQQIKPLLELYGYKLRRRTFKVYWVLDTDTSEKRFFRVEGKVILVQAFYDPRRDGAKLVKKIPLHRLVVHHQGGDQFLAVLQRRLVFEHSSEELECSVHDAIWNSEISEPMSSPQLIKFVDDYALRVLREFPSDANTLPFLIRQALLNHGIPVENVEEYPAVW